MKRIPVLAGLVLAVAAGIPGVAAAPVRATFDRPAIADGAAPVARGAAVVEAGIAPGIVVVSSTVTETQDGKADIYGEIRNDYDVPVEFLTVVGTAYGPKGKVIEQEDSFASLDPLDPGEKATFDIRLDETGDTYGVKVTKFEPSPYSANRNFTMQSSSSRAADGTVHISGTIRNDNHDATSVSIRLTYYDAKGLAIYDDIELVNDLTELLPGETAPFDLTYPSFFAPFSSYLPVPDGIGPPTTVPSLDFVFCGCFVGEKVKLEGTAGAGEQVTFEQYIKGAWTTMSGLSATADATTGEFAVPYVVTGPAWIRSVSISGKSAGMGVRMTAAATFTSSASSVKKGATVTLSGKVTPGTAGTVVTIQRKSGSRWLTAGSATLTASGTFAYKWRATSAGKYVLRVSVPMVGLIYGSQSTSRTVTVK